MTDQKAARVADAPAGLKHAGPAFELAHPLPPALLYRRCDPAELPFALCSEFEEAPDLIGQERAVEAIRFAMRMQRKGYNVYALGPTGSGRHALVQNLLRQQAEGEPTPPDWCYVNNFVDPQKPYCLQLPPGRGAGLAAAMKRLVEELRGALPAAFERDEYRSRREVIDQQFKQRNEAAFGALQKRAQQKGIALLRTPMGLALAPVRDGKVLEPDAFEALPESEREVGPARNRNNPKRTRGHHAAGAAMGARASRCRARPEPRNYRVCDRASDGGDPSRLWGFARGHKIPRRRRSGR